MKKNNNIMKSLLLALPVLMLGNTAQAEDAKCEAQLKVCDDAFLACEEEGESCWNEMADCFDSVDDSCLSFDPTGEEGEEFEEDEVEISEEDDAAIKGCEDSFQSCIDENGTDCGVELENCLFG